MLFNSLNTGSTDLRDTEVQQPNTTATLFLVMSSRAFSANSGQFDAGSTTTASSLRPSTPPFLFCSSISISMTSFSVVSLMAMVPDSEWRIPILIGAPWANALVAAPATKPAATRPVRTIDPNFIPLSLSFDGIPPPKRRKAKAVPTRSDRLGKGAIGPLERRPRRPIPGRPWPAPPRHQPAAAHPCRGPAPRHAIGRSQPENP